jgi:FixJ family two-component response regulator
MLVAAGQSRLEQVSSIAGRAVQSDPSSGRDQHAMRPAGKRAIDLLKGKAVFVVDDDPSTLKGVKRLLREHGFDCVLFQSAEALQKCDKFDQAFCIVLDVDLNDESGIEVRHRLIAAGISLPVIYITANDNHATRMAAMESGCVAYLTKPFSAKSLIEPIEKVSAGLA